MIEKLKNIKEIEIVSIKKTKLYDITLKYSNGESDTIKQYEGDPNKILHYLEYHQANLPE